MSGSWRTGCWRSQLKLPWIWASVFPLHVSSSSVCVGLPLSLRPGEGPSDQGFVHSEAKSVPPAPTSSSLRASFHLRPTVIGPGLGSGELTHGSASLAIEPPRLPCLTWKWKSLFTELVEEASCVKLVSPAGPGVVTKGL